MATKMRSSQGCWTCRLRRKKCDEMRPICEGCSGLEITCHFGDAKPDWMDGGPRQREMASLLKRQVKVQANHRRERKYLQTFELAASAPDFDDIGSDSEQHSPPSTSATNSGSDSQQASSTSPPSSAHHTPPSSDLFGLDTIKKTLPGFSSSNPAPPWESDPADDENEMNFVMLYFDHVFPYLFPLYRPSLLEGGRGWVLSLLRSNKAVYHTAVSLSSYFATTAIMAAEGIEGPCQARARDRLQEQQALALQELQSDMTNIVAKGPAGNVKASIRVLSSIIHLLIFDVAVTRSGQWCIHMSAAISLFNQIIPEPVLWHDRLIDHMGYTGVEHLKETGQTIPWTTEQAAMRTFGGTLFVLDILASTAAERRPLLQGFHATALDLEHCRDHTVERRALIKVEDLFGMQTWVIYLVGEIAALDAWKKENRKLGTLSVTQLVSRAAVLDKALREGIACLLGQCPIRACKGEDECSDGNPRLPHPSHDTTPHVSDVLALYGRFNADERHCLVPIYTMIWGYGALVYLSVVVSGWQPASEEIVAPITAALELFEKFPSPICTRIVSWPFFVVGCLSPPHVRPKLREIVTKMGTLDIFGSVHTALAAMETVWDRGDIIDEQWDIAACLQSLGHPVLLV